MAWYRAGTVAVTNGSAVITGSGTAWVNNVQIGHAINLPDGRAYEVLSVDSNAQITLGSPYLGGTAAGQAYSVQPNQGFAQSAATKLTEFLTQISQWVSGALAGRFGDGSLAAPGISFAVDQDTGIRRYNDNVLSIVCGGADTVLIGPAGTSFYANAARVGQMVVGGLALDTGKGLTWTGNVNEVLIPSDGVAGWLWKTDGRILVQYSNGTPKFVIEAAGHVRPGTDNGQTLGSAATRWSTVYAGTGSINTSDQREKDDIGEIPDEWLDAWGDVQWRRFKFNDAIAAKGDDARWHLGLVAQEVRDAFAARNLDARDIGLLCFDEWEATPARAAVRDEEGEIITPARPAIPAGDRWGLRYDECQAIEAAYQRRRLAQLEASIAALAPKNA